MDPTSLLFSLIYAPIGLAVAAGIAWTIYYSNRSTMHRAMRRYPLIKIGKIRGNEDVRLVGAIDSIPAPLIAPLSKQPCAHYRVRVDAISGIGETATWENVVALEGATDFYVRDDSGRARVDTEYSEILAKDDLALESGWLTAIPLHYEDFLVSRGVSLLETGEMSSRKRRFRYREETLTLNENVVVAGATMLEEPLEGVFESELGYREGLSPRVVILGSSRKPVLISDLRGAPRKE